MKPDHLPGVLAEMAEMSSVAQALDFAAKYGGGKIYFPNRFSSENEACVSLVDVFGEQAARSICRRLGGCDIVIPVARRQRLEAAIASGASNREIRRMLCVSGRTIQRARMRMAEA